MDYEKFSNILMKIKNSYGSMAEFGRVSGVNRTYMSKYLNQKMQEPPSPKILRRIANNSKGLVSYMELMKMCGWL